MKLFQLFTIIILLSSCSESNTSDNSQAKELNYQEVPEGKTSNIGTPRIVVHGGAGAILPENLDQEKRKAYQDKLTEALEAGYKILSASGTSSEAVIKVIQVLEASPLFNAGVGAVLTNDESISHDASFMDGATNQAGAVAGVNKIKSPILAAYMVRLNSDHVMLSGEGAHEFAKDQGLEMVSPEYFITEKRLNQLHKVKEQNAEDIDPDVKDKKMGTVGACALDKFGNIAAGTSTGGMTNKKYGRIGDSPIIGSGSYANNQTCAVSSTGHGEFFIRNVVAYDIAARMKYLNESLSEASNAVIEELGSKNGLGGVICLDRSGEINMPFNTSGMFRGYLTDTSGVIVKMFNDQ